MGGGWLIKPKMEWLNNLKKVITAVLLLLSTFPKWNPIETETVALFQNVNPKAKRCSPELKDGLNFTNVPRYFCLFVLGDIYVLDQ